MNKISRSAFLSLFALALTGASDPETRLTVALAPEVASADNAGRLLIFAEPATPENSNADAVDFGRPGSKNVSVAARDVTSFGAGGRVTVDMTQMAFPQSFADLAPGDYRLQVVFDPQGDYNYAGRGPGDLVSKVTTLRFPLASPPSISLDRQLPPESAQFDTAGLPPKAAEQIAASRSHLHDEQIISKALTHFRGTAGSVAAWVLTPPGYDPAAPKTYPTVYLAGGFGTTHKLDGQLLSQTWHLMETGVLPPMIWVSLGHGTPRGTTEFVDSANNGPWGEALVKDVIPALEARYRMDAKPSGRFLTGHSSGGWFALSTIVRYPSLFGGAWATSPDPVDFRDFLGVDLYARGANMYRTADGAPRPLERDEGKVRMTIEQAAKVETVLGHDGGQLRSFEWTFSPRAPGGTPAPMFDRRTGAVDPRVASYWRENYDIGHRIETDWPRLKSDLDGKIHIAVGTADSYYLDGSVHRLEEAMRRVGAKADFTFVPDATHSMAEVYAGGGDRNALWKAMTRAMNAIARPDKISRRHAPG